MRLISPIIYLLVIILYPSALLSTSLRMNRPLTKRIYPLIVILGFTSENISKVATRSTQRLRFRKPLRNFLSCCKVCAHTCVCHLLLLLTSCELGFQDRSLARSLARSRVLSSRFAFLSSLRTLTQREFIASGINPY